MNQAKAAPKPIGTIDLDSATGYDPYLPPRYRDLPRFGVAAPVPTVLPAWVAV